MIIIIIFLKSFFPNPQPRSTFPLSQEPPSQPAGCKGCAAAGSRACGCCLGSRQKGALPERSSRAAPPARVLPAPSLVPALVCPGLLYGRTLLAPLRALLPACPKPIAPASPCFLTCPYPLPLPATHTCPAAHCSLPSLLPAYPTYLPATDPHLPVHDPLPVPCPPACSHHKSTLEKHTRCSLRSSCLSPMLVSKAEPLPLGRRLCLWSKTLCT